MEGREKIYPLWQALVGVVICALLWGSAFPCIKTVYGIWEEAGIEVSSFTRWWVAGIRFCIAGGALLLLARRPFQQLKSTSKRDLSMMVLMQTFLQYILFYISLVLLSGSLCSLLTVSGSFWWLLLAPLFGRAVWGGWKVWGILVLGCIGVGIAVYSPTDTSSRPVLGILLMLAANFCGAVALLYFGKVKETMDAKAATGFSLFIGGLGLCVLGAPAAGQTREMFTPVVIGITLHLALVSAAAFSIWNELSTRYEVSLLATYRFMIPVVGVILSVLILDGEEFSLQIILGGVFVAIAMVLAQRLQRR